ncbi:helix-turn-helix domain-containing protein [Bacillus sp. DNRA2]|uniref:helix-turn-helix domain-containing protein n=1 Tax=Bacillus sp. DNRA2 TaxID=2723053 RepID=UPI00145F7B29|nr:helix-turn-helix domain-containing protein [Bacillus sp. DNRA2]NMD71353.1 helix-turn-helix domain-containing protein [Bacillus sp. DNRA2]
MKPQSKAELILHPVRLKIIQSLTNGKHLTAHAIAERNKEIPQATLYRQLNTLLEAEIIQVVKENPIRGTIEKVYALNEPSIQSQQDLLNLSKEEHLELFMTFTTQLLAQYEAYLDKEDIDLVRDGVSYRIGKLYLSDAEFKELVMKMGSLLQDAMQHEPSPERKARNLATIIIPE